MKIGTKVNLILMIVLISGLLISGITLSSILERKAEKEVASQALTIMQLVNSVRKYTNDEVHPLLLPKLDTQVEFIPESIPSSAVKEVFEIFRKNKDFSNFLYKDATINPTNLEDKADKFETDIVQRFRQESDLKSLSGFRTIFGESMFYNALPFKIEQESCLRCHSTPELAPKSQLVTYGRENGFGWKLHDIVATQIVYVPAEKIFQTARNSFIVNVGVLILIFSAIIIIMNLLLKRTVLQRIKKIATVAEQVSVGDMNANFGKQGKDEIGALAEAITRMKYSLEIALDLLNDNNKTSGNNPPNP